MPIFEHSCFHSECADYGRVQEDFFHSRANVTKPKCPACKRPMTRVASRFGVVFTGVITARYNDKNLDGAHKEGHFAWRRRSSKGGFDKPEKTFISNFSEQKRFCKEEGLALPSDMPRHVEVSADGKKLSSRGMPGQWI